MSLSLFITLGWFCPTIMSRLQTGRLPVYNTRVSPVRPAYFPLLSIRAGNRRLRCARFIQGKGRKGLTGPKGLCHSSPQWRRSNPSFPSLKSFLSFLLGLTARTSPLRLGNAAAGPPQNETFRSISPSFRGWVCLRTSQRWKGRTGPYIMAGLDVYKGTPRRGARPRRG